MSKPAIASCFSDDVAAERQRQNEKWGVQRHEWGDWIAILGEEFGEACQEALRLKFDRSNRLLALRAELVQVAAVSAQIIEHIDEILGVPKEGEDPQ